MKYFAEGKNKYYLGGNIRNEFDRVTSSLDLCN